MRSYELMREVFQSTSAKQVASDLGLSISLVYKWAESPTEGNASGTTNPLDRMAALLRSTNHDPRLIQWICEQANGFFIKNPKPKHTHSDALVPATNQIVQEFADLLSVIATAALDNQISADEAEKIRRRWEDLKSETESFVQCCEHGDFSKMKESLPALRSAKPK